MSSPPLLRASVVEAKAFLAEKRTKLREQHEIGSPGIQVSNGLADCLDTIMIGLFESILADLGDASQNLRSQLALVALGGYGRRDVAPFSDVDLMLLHRTADLGRLEQVAQRLVADVSDVGLTLGFSVRSPAEACRLASRNVMIFTSQVESRLVAGSEAVFESFISRFQRQTRRRRRANIARIEDARRHERSQYGETVFLLEPNIKRSVGGLRDIHLLRWVGFARYGEASPSSLQLQGVLSKEDERAIRRALQFLLRLRNELHFHAGRPYDVLYRAEQMRIAETWGYEGSESILPVERFMSDYFLHTQNVRNTGNHFRAAARRRSEVLHFFAPLVTHRLEDDYRVGPYHLSVTKAGREKLKGNLEEVLRLMDLANQLGKWIDHDTWNTVRNDMRGRTDIMVTPQAAQRFMSLLSYTARLGNLLRRLHELQVLEKFVEGMAHARCLLQFNRYHKYTVDEHCLLAVESATRFQTDEGTLGKTYRSIEQRGLLHLALLIHDLGKGLPGDHSEIGAELAEKTAERLWLSARDKELLQFLVKKHLVMSHLAFWRDPNDESIILQFVREVGSPEYLKMLYVLTAADLAAVGPGVLNPWKLEILTAVYQRANFHLRGQASDSDSVILSLNQQRTELLQMAPADDLDWYEAHIATLSSSFLYENAPQKIIEDLQQLRNVSPDQATAWGRYLPDQRVVEYSIGFHESLKAGVFHRLTGALTARGLKILSASIQTLSDGLILDRFCVEDPDYEGDPPQERLSAVSQSLEQAVEAPSEYEPVFRRTWNPAAQNEDPARLNRMPTRVLIDNTTLSDCTILDVFTHDRQGLLFAITRKLYELGLSVKYAKIGTFLDQVVDVFYVTDLDGTKVRDESRLERIRVEVVQSIGLEVDAP